MNNHDFQAAMKNIAEYSGRGSGLVTFVVPSNYRVDRLRAMIQSEKSSAQNIKDKNNRQLVSAALTQALSFVDTLGSVPANGMALFVGAYPDGNRTRYVQTVLEPPNAITKFIYRCGSKFETDYVMGLSSHHDAYGFVVIDGNGALFATVVNAASTVHQHYEVDLPNKQRKGGQSSVRFARLRL